MSLETPLVFRLFRPGSVSDTLTYFWVGFANATGFNGFPSLTGNFKLAAGDTITINGYAGGSSTSYSSTATQSRLSIARIGS